MSSDLSCPVIPQQQHLPNITSEQQPHIGAKVNLHYTSGCIDCGFSEDKMRFPVL